MAIKRILVSQGRTKNRGCRVFDRPAPWFREKFAIQSQPTNGSWDKDRTKGSMRVLQIRLRFPLASDRPSAKNNGVEISRIPPRHPPWHARLSKNVLAAVPLNRR